MLARQRSATSTVVDVSRERLPQSDAAIELAEAMLAMAELNLSYTVVTAPCDGYTSRKEIEVGQLVQPGQTLLDVVDSGDVWVAANYKETQLRHIRPGSEVDVEVDAIPGVTFHGSVESISTATGASLSLLPQDNSAGNFVKVRQRVPVRIVFSADNPDIFCVAVLRRLHHHRSLLRLVSGQESCKSRPYRSYPLRMISPLLFAIMIGSLIVPVSRFTYR